MDSTSNKKVLDNQEQIWYEMLVKYINDTAKFKLFQERFIEILDKLIESLLNKE